MKDDRFMKKLEEKIHRHNLYLLMNGGWGLFNYFHGTLSELIEDGIEPNQAFQEATDQATLMSMRSEIRKEFVENFDDIFKWKRMIITQALSAAGNLLN